MNKFLNRLPVWMVIAGGVVVVAGIWTATVMGGPAGSLVSLLVTVGAAKKVR